MFPPVWWVWDGWDLRYSSTLLKRHGLLKKKITPYYCFYNLKKKIIVFPLLFYYSFIPYFPAPYLVYFETAVFDETIDRYIQLCSTRFEKTRNLFVFFPKHSINSFISLSWKLQVSLVHFCSKQLLLYIDREILKIFFFFPWHELTWYIQYPFDSS